MWYLCNEGFFVHSDLGINDIEAVLSITRVPFENKFGEYVMDNSSAKKFVSINYEGEFSIPSRENDWCSVMETERREHIMDDHDRTVILHKEKNTLAYYRDDGSLIEEIECKFDESGRITFIRRNLGSEVYIKEGYYVTYDTKNNISKVELKEYSQVGYEKYELSELTEISFLWADTMPTGITITRTKKGEVLESPIMLKMKVKDVNSKGKWTKMQVDMVEDGKDMPTFLYIRDFYNSIEEFRSNQ